MVSRFLAQAYFPPNKLLKGGKIIILSIRLMGRIFLLEIGRYIGYLFDIAILLILVIILKTIKK